MEDLFREFFWLIFPIFGMGIGVFAIYMAHRSKRRAFDILRIYAEQGKEPPQSVIDALTTDPDERYYRHAKVRHGFDSEYSPFTRNPTVLWSRFVLLAFLAVGFAGIGFWYKGLSFPFYITAFVLAAVAASTLVRALLNSTSAHDRRDDEPR